MNQFSRSELVFGKPAMERLFESKVAVFGVGGVGGFAVEALARSGIGSLDLFDNDRICLTNLNRQIHATTSSIGKYKVDVAKERVLDINPAAIVFAHRLFYVPETSMNVDLSKYDHVIDAIDTVSGKLELAVKSYEAGVPIISSMGAGNKVNPASFEVADVFETSVCPLARVMRQELRKRGVPRLKVVFSKELPIAPRKDASHEEDECTCVACAEGRPGFRRQTPGSTSFVPAVVGMIIAGEVIKSLLEARQQPHSE